MFDIDFDQLMTKMIELKKIAVEFQIKQKEMKEVIDKTYDALHEYEVIFDGIDQQIEEENEKYLSLTDDLNELSEIIEDIKLDLEDINK